MQNKCSYGLQRVLPQLVPPVPPPSALTAVGMTRVLMNNTAAPRTSSICFTVGFSLLQESNRDIFNAARASGKLPKMLVFVRNS